VAVQARVVSLPELGRALVDLRGRGGVRQLREITSLLLTGSHSQAEQRLIRLLSNARMVGWAANFRVRIRDVVVIIDVAFPKSMVAVEVDGRAWHTDARTFVSDRQRQNLLVNAGWTVLRFTWTVLTDRPGSVLSEIRSALLRAA
jgi:very-short-patch-repair endonuclease